MEEFLFCSIFTLLPDYLVRRYVQGKRIGREITFLSVWYELRWGLTANIMLAVALITIIIYYHPATSNVTSFFRTVTILPTERGRVVEVFVEDNQHVEAGQKLFALEDDIERASVDLARRQVAEIDAELDVAKTELGAVLGAIKQAEAEYQDALDEFLRKQTLAAEQSPSIDARAVERAATLRDARQGALQAAVSNKEALEAKIGILLPAQKATAVADLKRAEALLAKRIVYAGTSGRVEQFALRPGDVTVPLLRPAGILVPEGAGRSGVQAGFDQVSTQVIKPGMIGEISCFSTPFRIIPMVVTKVQDVIAAGQFRPTDELIDIEDRARLGTLTVFMEPLYAEQIVSIPPGSKCIAALYSDHSAALEKGNLSLLARIYYYIVDAVGIDQALILRIRAIILPIRVAIFSGG